METEFIPQHNLLTKKQIFNNENTQEIEVSQEVKKIDIFDKNFFELLSNCYYNKTTKKSKQKSEFVIPFNNLKVRVYIYRCLNLSAQDDSSDAQMKLAGMSAFSKANSYLEVIIGEDQQMYIHS